MLEDGVCDLVMCNMALMDIEQADLAMQEVARVLKPAGRWVLSLPHPCFDKMGTSGWDIEQISPTTTHLAQNEPLSRDDSCRSALAVGSGSGGPHTRVSSPTVLVYSHVTCLWMRMD
jgi:Methyltransferase domain